MKKPYVITISRTCGAGGTAVGKLLSERLNIPMYGKELLRMASDISGINEQLFTNADERVKNSHLFEVSRKVYSREVLPPSDEGFTSDQNLFNYQAKVLRELAQNESYIIIGRCGDYILKDFPNIIRVFITASEKDCVARKMQKDGLTKNQALAEISRLNNERANFYHYYTDQTWSNAGNYDLCISASHLSIEGCADLIVSYTEKRLGASV